MTYAEIAIRPSICFYTP